MASHALRSFGRHSAPVPAVLAVLAAVFWYGAARVRAAEAPPEPVTTIDQIQFRQANAQAQMEELQNRMFRLADLTREAEPDDAAKLLMAVRAARQQLILEQMRGNLDLLNGKDFTHAADEQAQIIAKLEDLKRLLTSGVGDLEMLLERLRGIDESIKKLDAATAEEKRQRDASGKLAQQPPKPADPKAAQDPKSLNASKALGNLKQDQQQNRKATENIAQAVKGLGGGAATAGAKLGSAAQSMSAAEGALGSGKPSDAQVQQTEAVESMQQARKQLNEERDKVLAAVEKLVRKQVVMNLTEMLERQKSVRAGTESAVERSASQSGGQSGGGTARAELQVKIRQLGATETSIVRIADQTVRLIEQTGFSVALPPAIKRVQQKMAVIAATLDDARVDPPLVKSETQVERDLQDLLDTFKELAAAKVTPGNCNCKGDHNKLEAELKVVRMMQLRVNDDTVGVDGQRGGAAPAAAVPANLPANIDPLLREKILAVRDGQADVKTAMDKIRQQLAGPDEPTP